MWPKKSFFILCMYIKTSTLHRVKYTTNVAANIVLNKENIALMTVSPGKIDFNGWMTLNSIHLWYLISKMNPSKHRFSFIEHSTVFFIKRCNHETKLQRIGESTLYCKSNHDMKYELSFIDNNLTIFIREPYKLKSFLNSLCSGMHNEIYPHVIHHFNYCRGKQNVFPLKKKTGIVFSESLYGCIPRFSIAIVRVNEWTFTLNILYPLCFVCQ